MLLKRNIHILLLQEGHDFTLRCNNILNEVHAGKQPELLGIAFERENKIGAEYRLPEIIETHIFRRKLQRVMYMFRACRLDPELFQIVVIKDVFF